ncbi:hypothetical protein FIE12Z_10606 [Fusarium flagelliforme]|uniref:HTH CENPB-type domain-containing protein n=1 Tax=Fusarium flagelliforme TaxID=2675880 RepID=A0A395MB91_9HYPO|nr:hypothetical protein FIE12Z_10606 [Fusarium flagelliforme]
MKTSFDEQQEKDLVNFLLPEEAAGRGLSQHKIRQVVTEIINPESDDITVGNNWALRFAKRHKELNSMYTTYIEATRSIYATPGTLRPFYGTLSQQMKELDVPPARLHNMDEHGMREGYTKSGKMIGTSLTHRALTSECDNRNWVSVLESISAIGRRTTPTVVFGGNSLQGQWFQEAFPDWKYDYSVSGWATGRNPEDWRILVLDGFYGHITPKFRFRAEFNRALDVGIFGPLKRYFAQGNKRFATFSVSSTASKRRFLESYKVASKKAMTERNIRHAFRGAGMFPVDVEKPLEKTVQNELPP